jgi:hypothetical protein
MVRKTVDWLLEFLDAHPQQRASVFAQLGLELEEGETGPQPGDTSTDGPAQTRLGGDILEDVKELAEGRALMFRLKQYEHKHPELSLFHHIPNGGKRDIVTAVQMRDSGVRAGIPDYFLPVARGQHHGLYIELKRDRGGQTSPAQNAIIARLREQGYRVEVCKGHLAAIRVLEEYLNIKLPLTLIP